MNSPLRRWNGVRNVRGMQLGLEFGAFAVASIGVAYATLAAWHAVRAIAATPLLSDVAADGLEAWPQVTLIVTASNEAATLERAVTSRLEDDYPNLRVLLVDDRSTDDTPSIVDRLAAGDPRVQAVHIRRLPARWHGKVHAMHEGFVHAHGEWVLFSDADVYFEKGTLRRAIVFAETHGLDHLATFPVLWARASWLDVAMGWIFRAVRIGGAFRSVGHPQSRAAAGTGLVNLVRRQTMVCSPGLPHLRREPAGDLALAQMLKQSGARTGVVNASGLIGMNGGMRLRPF